MRSFTIGEKISIYRVQIFRIGNKGITTRPDVVGSIQSTSMC